MKWNALKKKTSPSGFKGVISMLDLEVNPTNKTKYFTGRDLL